jgi:hypothetical protein
MSHFESEDKSSLIFRVPVGTTAIKELMMRGFLKQNDNGTLRPLPKCRDPRHQEEFDRIQDELVGDDVRAN